MTRAHLADPHIVRKIDRRPGGRDPPVRRRHVLPRSDLRVRRGAVHPQRGDEPRGDDAARDPAGAEPRRVVVVGAGPAGLEAARVAGERGHDVTVLEAMPWAGGQIRLAARNPRRRDLLGIVEWRVRRARPARRRGALRRPRRRRRRHRPRSRRRHRRHRRPAAAPRAGGGRRAGGDELGRDRRRRHADRRRAVLRRQRHPLGDVGGRDDRPLGRSAGDRHAGADARHRRRRDEPRAVRPGVQRDRHPHHAQPAGAARVRPEARPAVRRDRQRPQRRIAACATSTAVVVDHGTAASAELYFELKPASRTSAPSTTARCSAAGHSR